MSYLGFPHSHFPKQTAFVRSDADCRPGPATTGLAFPKDTDTQAPLALGDGL